MHSKQTARGNGAGSTATARFTSARTATGPARSTPAPPPGSASVSSSMARRSRRPATSSSRPCSRRVPGFRFLTSHGGSTCTWSTGWRTSSSATGARPPTTLYEMIVRLYLIPGLGNRRLTSLSVPAVQKFLNQRLEKGDSVRKVQVMRTVLSAALDPRGAGGTPRPRTSPAWPNCPNGSRGTIHPWSADEARHFLAAARTDPLYAAFVLLILYGLRRGEALGLRWDDIDFDDGDDPDPPAAPAHPRPAAQLGPVKTRAGQRDPAPARSRPRRLLSVQAEQQAAYRADMGSAWPDTGLVFTTRTGRPIEPRNLVRSFRRICDDQQASGRSRSTTFATLWLRCSRTCTSRPATRKRSSGIPGSPPLWRSIPMRR